MAPLGVGVGDVIIVSKICLSLYQACTKGRKGAPAAVLDLANELWACSTALDQLSAVMSRPNGIFDSGELQDIFTRVISGCRSSLGALQKLVDKYDDINKEPSSFDGRRWVRKLRINVKKSRWMYEEEEIQHIRNRIETNVQALNLLWNMIAGDTLRDVKAQLAELHACVQALTPEKGLFSRLSAPQIQTLRIDNGVQDQTSISGELQHIWQSVMTDCLIISRSQVSGSSLYDDYRDQIADLWEGFCLARRQTNTRPTGAARPTVDASIPSDSLYDPPTFENISGFIKELGLITSVGMENARLQLPRFVSTIIYETLKPRQRIQSRSARLTDCLENVRFISQWLQKSREECIHNGIPHTDVGQGSGPLLDDYLAVIKQVVGYWSLILRSVRMTCSQIYPAMMLDFQPQLLVLQQQVEESSRIYWEKVRKKAPSADIPVSAWQDYLDTCSAKYFQNSSESTMDKNLRAWLKPVDEVDEERALQRSRQWPNTCQWIFSKASYCDWMLGVLPGILWCHARPGSGKSVLSSFLAQQFQDAGETCCFFPFRYNNEALRKPQNLLRTIAFQMAEQDPQIRARLTELRTEDLDVESARLGLLWQKIFCNGVFRSQSTELIYWVIDALDEAESTELLQLLSLLSDLQTSERPIKVIMFSRYNRDIAMRLSSLPIAVSEVLPEDNTEDIRLYTRERLAKSAIMLQDQHQVEILDIIVTRSSGTFLWVAKAVDALEQQEVIADVLASVNDSAHTLSALYDNIMSQMARMKARQMQIAKAMLGWTTCAARPLYLDELAVVLKAKFGALTDVSSTVKNLCGQLLGVDKQQRVQANHMTVHEYLKSTARSDFRVDPESWDYHIASFCLEVLSAGDGPEYSDDEKQQSLCALDIQTFKEYACLFWYVHLGRTCCSTKRMEYVSTFLASAGGLSWLKGLAVYQRLDQTLAAARTLKMWTKTDENVSSIAVLAKIQRLAARLGYTDDKYTGKLVHGLRQGNGSSFYANGDKYVGGWRGDVREGKGICTFATGVIYEGMWSNDEFHGHGRLSSPDGCVYEGDWVAGRRDGFGVMYWTWTERFRYEGQWSQDRFHGLGTMIYYTGSNYVGDWADGREHGHGTITYWNGDTYEGEFEDGCETGEIERQGETPDVVYDDDTRATATVHYSSGTRYEGHVNKQGLPSGSGTLHGTTGISWIGEFENGRANGDGCAIRPPEGRLIGPMHNFVAEGHFIDINGVAGGGKYTGQLSDTAREGHGQLETAFNYDYEGEFHRNEMHGRGVRKYQNGDFYEGFSRDGCMEGYGRMVYHDGWVYRGLWLKDNKNGTGGTLELPGWGKFVGTWVNDQIRTDSIMTMTDETVTLAGLP